MGYEASLRALLKSIRTDSQKGGMSNIDDLDYRQL